MIGHCNSLIDQPAGVSAQVENQSIDMIGIEFIKRLGQFRIGGFIELLDPDVADTRILEKEGFDAWFGDLLAGYRKAQQLLQPSRWTPICTVVPAGPFSNFDTRSVCFSSEGSRPSADFPLTVTMMSPGRIPARNAGEPEIGETTKVSNLPIFRAATQWTYRRQNTCPPGLESSRQRRED